uniref:Uncharacterized protein n=1 Tax=Anopheles culicifacies TaxID=139723 RepID=A0A182M1T9_9DIPT
MVDTTHRTERCAGGDRLSVERRCPIMGTAATNINSASGLCTSTVRIEVSLSQRCINTVQTGIRHNRFNVPSVRRRNGIILSEGKQWTSRIQRNYRIDTSVLCLTGTSSRMGTQTVPDNVDVVRVRTSIRDHLIDQQRHCVPDRSNQVARCDVVRIDRTNAPIDGDQIEIAHLEVCIREQRIHEVRSIVIPSVNGETRRMGRVKV